MWISAFRGSSSGGYTLSQSLCSTFHICSGFFFLGRLSLIPIRKSIAKMDTSSSSPSLDNCICNADAHRKYDSNSTFFHSRCRSVKDPWKFSKLRFWHRDQRCAEQYTYTIQISPRSLQMGRGATPEVSGHAKHGECSGATRPGVYYACSIFRQVWAGVTRTKVRKQKPCFFSFPRGNARSLSALALGSKTFLETPRMRVAASAVRSLCMQMRYVRA